MDRFNIWNRVSAIAILAAFTSIPAMATITPPLPDETPPSDPPAFTATAASATAITLTWGASTDDKAVTAYHLQRCQPGSCQSSFSVAASPRTYSSTGLTPGVTYTYYLTAADAAGNESNSVTASATVSGGSQPQADSLENQLNYVYETRLGDLNGDNLIDVYVNRTAGGQSGNGSLERFILQQIAAGKFTTIVPTSAQTTVASGWVSNPINKGIDDINFDGYADLILKLSTVIPGALDQIVYAPAQTSVSAPKGIKAVDPEFRKFLRDLMGWIAKPNYFSNPPLVRVPTFNYVQQCVSYCNYDHNQPSETLTSQTCFMVPVVVGTTLQYDYSGFSQSALSFGQIVNQAGSGDLGPTGTSALKQILDTGLGVSTGLGVTAGTADWPIWTDAESNPWLVRFLTRFSVISVALMMTGDNTDETYYFHYTPAANVPAILASGQLLSATGLVYLTKTMYGSRTQALTLLALPAPPDVGLVLTSREMGPPEPTFVGVVIPRYGQPGGGLEWTRVPPVPLGWSPRVFNLLP